MDFVKASPVPEDHKQTWTDLLLRALAVYLIPVGMVLASVLAAMLLDRVYPDVSGRAVVVRILPTSEHTALDPATAYGTLTQLPARGGETGSHAWLLADVPQQAEATDFLLEFPSRHIDKMICWDAGNMALVGRAVRSPPATQLHVSKLGFNVQMGLLQRSEQVLCHASFVQSSAITARLWRAGDFHLAASKFDHTIGMLEGGLLTPAVLMLVIALVTRERTYALLAAWLVTNLRLGAFAIGWDSQWLGYMIPADLMPLIRHITAAVYYLLTIGLLTRLLYTGNYHDHPRLLALAKLSAIAMLPVALFAPVGVFWPVVGIVAVFGLAVAVLLLSSAWKKTRLTAWAWQIVALGVAFSILVGLAGILVFGDINELDSTYTTMLLLVSNAAMAMALIERVRNVRFAQQRLQTELVTSYAITPIGMFTLDAQRRFTHMNPVLENTLGFTVASHPEARWTDYFPDVDWDQLNARTLADEDVEITALKPDRHGKTRHFAIRALMVDNRIEGSLNDISAHTALIDQLRIMAGKDPVTEALNQRGIESALQRALKQLDSGQPASLACLNLSHFKSINSLFGYATGDALLAQTRRTISDSLKPMHELGRLGGDEFAILFPGQTAAEVEPALRELTEIISNRVFTVGPHTMNIKVSVGLIDLSSETSTPKEALFAAGRACRDGQKDPSRIAIYQKGSAALREHRELLRLFDMLEAGYTPEGFRVELQPILSMQNYARSWNFEALLRVLDSQGTPIDAGRVIAAAEDIGPITTIDKWVLEYVLSWLEDNARHLPNLELVSINISGVSLNSQPFIQHLFRLLDRYKHVTHKLVIEMTEGVALENVEHAQHIMSQLQAMGVRVGLDDFGSGYTSFSYLRRLNADVIKIDGTLIHNMLASENNTAIVQTIIQLASQLNMKCIAEWVEDIDTLEALYKMGVDYVQGYVISRAMPLAKVRNAKSIEDFLTTDDARDFVRRVLHRQL